MCFGTLHRYCFTIRYHWKSHISIKLFLPYNFPKGKQVGAGIIFICGISIWSNGNEYIKLYRPYSIIVPKAITFEREKHNMAVLGNAIDKPSAELKRISPLSYNEQQ